MKMMAMMLNRIISDNDNGDDIDPEEPSGGSDYGNNSCDDVTDEVTVVVVLIMPMVDLTMMK